VEFTTTILGRRWRIVACDKLVETYGFDGMCDPPGSPRKAIRYDPSMEFWRTMDALGHEAHHAAFPSTDHDDLNQFHTDVTRIQRKVTESRWVILTREEYDSLMEKANASVDGSRNGTAAEASERRDGLDCDF
jgi:hypothetical protein